MSSTNQNLSQTLSITGMTCSGCVKAVTRALSQIPGVRKAEVDLAGGRAVVEGTARSDDLVAAVAAAGFGAEPQPSRS